MKKIIKSTNETANLANKVSKCESDISEIKAMLKSQNEVLAGIQAQLQAKPAPKPTPKPAPQKSSKKKAAEQTSDKDKKPKKIEVPKLTEEQLLNWSYYKACRRNYCYEVLGCKVWKGKVTYPKNFQFDQKKWDKAREDFEKVNKYVKVADR